MTRRRTDHIIERALMLLPRRQRARIFERLIDSRRLAPIAPTERIPSYLPDIELLRLGHAQLFREARFQEFDDLVGRKPMIDRNTPIGSMGSCFSGQIKRWLVDNGYSYVQTSDAPQANAGSAAFGEIYNTFCLRQEVERALDEFAPQVRCWPLPDGRIISPYRHHVSWTSEEHMEAELADHRRASRAAFETARVFIVTLAITEVWYDRRDGVTFVSVPPAGVHDPDVHGFRTSTYHENVDNLHRLRDGLRRLNPAGHLIVSVSPVPMRASFNQDESILLANARAKATLLAAARDFVATSDDTSYFPSYELVTDGFSNARTWDGRHIKASVIDQVMHVFSTVYATSG